jgi:molybdopterin converting factor small subunit
MSLKITVRSFSHVREALGKETVTLELSDGADTSDVEKTVREMAGGALDGISFRIAVNRKYLSSPTELKDGDEVALIPPVQGG